MAEDPNVGKTLTAHPNYLTSFGMALPAVFPAHLDDISDAVIFLASDLSRAVTATQLTVDMGATKIKLNPWMGRLRAVVAVWVRRDRARARASAAAVPFL